MSRARNVAVQEDTRGATAANTDLASGVLGRLACCLRSSTSSRGLAPDRNDCIVDEAPNRRAVDEKAAELAARGEAADGIARVGMRVHNCWAVRPRNAFPVAR